MVEPYRHEFVIPGSPVIKKNGMQIWRHSLHPNKRYREKSASALATLRAAWNGRPPLEPPYWLMLVFFHNSRGKTKPDQSNCYEAYQDWLQEAGIIENDREVCSHDGSRMFCVCDICPENRPQGCGHMRECKKIKTLIIIRPYRVEECPGADFMRAIGV